MDIYGTVNWDRIALKEGDDDYPLWRQGRTTGSNAGKITEVYPSTKEFVTDTDSEGGDSGGPYYEDVYGTAMMVGVHSYGYSNSDSAGGFAMDRILDKLDMRKEKY